MVEELSQAQFDTVYNFLSLVIAAQLFTALFLLLNLRKVLPKYRMALIISATVCGIAAYHYFRIFDSFGDAYVTDAVGGMGTYVLAEGTSFNVAYRYVDWLLTVPLLLLEAIAVLALARKTQTSLLIKLIPAAVLMIVLGYPGEISDDFTTKAVWGALSSIPFVYILYVLFIELGRILAGAPKEVAVTVRNLRLLLIATWGVYPIAYMFPMLGLDGSDAFVAREIGYSVADILAKAMFALVIFRIARLKSAYDDPEYAEINDPGTLMLIEEVDGVRPTGVANARTARTGEAERQAGAARG
ncbi:bacteriorhodopsin-like [Aquipuribacter sp. MA13-6]|uniref:bacteriorhodopsin-like n=1 Tax=unclassified Aquipuribacter TaxID=2635084 RepID=UPI003EEBBE07